MSFSRTCRRVQHAPPPRWFVPCAMPRARHTHRPMSLQSGAADSANVSRDRRWGARNRSHQLSAPPNGLLCGGKSQCDQSMRAFGARSQPADQAKLRCDPERLSLGPSRHNCPTNPSAFLPDHHMGGLGRVSASSKNSHCSHFDGNTIEDTVANRDTAVGCHPFQGEDATRQVAHREGTTRFICAWQPAWDQGSHMTGILSLIRNGRCFPGSGPVDDDAGVQQFLDLVVFEAAFP